jgi:diaminohydroxyphosphoribosylaminopyrimidine deaminase/5-amino-6-(5-phosphoribosylamino)uracil reductase
LDARVIIGTSFKNSVNRSFWFSVSFSPSDRRFMLRTLWLAARGQGFVEPNPMVGAVIVKNGRTLGEGWHRRFGGPHAEIAALSDARRRGENVSGATLYVNLEPCAHFGKTPPCAPTVAESGIRRVVIAVRDPLRRVHAGKRGPDGTKSACSGLAVMRRKGVQVEFGLCREEAVVLNAPFFKLAATGLPLVIAKWAMSADGKIASRSGESRWISGPESREIVHAVRGRVDAIVVGSHTARQDDPLLTCRTSERRRIAARVVLCGASVPDVKSRLVKTVSEAPVVLAYPAGSPPPGLKKLTQSGCEALPIEGKSGSARLVNLRGLLRALSLRGASTVLVEGGSETLGNFFDQRLVDRVMVFVAPIILGGQKALTPVGGKGVLSPESALRLIGEVSWGGHSPRSEAVLHTCARVIGRDILIEGWLTDPLTWIPKGD